jgi:hypothetical protein
MFFTILQGYKYIEVYFTIVDLEYGSVFFIAKGFPFITYSSTYRVPLCPL